MLTDEEKRELEPYLGHYPDKAGATAEALKIVQAHRGWVSDEGVRDIAEFMGQTPDEVDGIATFYSRIYRQPVGRHVIILCDSVSCWIMGYNEIREHISKRLGIGMGETTADGRFTMLPTACLGVCEQAPAMMVDEDVHGNLTAAKADEILGRYK